MTLKKCTFCEIPSNGSKYIVSERSYADTDADADAVADADMIRTKNNMSPTFGWGDVTSYTVKLYVSGRIHLVLNINLLLLQCFSVGASTGCLHGLFSVMLHNALGIFHWNRTHLQQTKGEERGPANKI